MPRARMIKPEFWTDGRLTECSLSTRLLFIGLWTFADDFGNIEFCPKQIKMQVFPGDDVDVCPMIAELITKGMLVPYSEGGSKYLNIKNFNKHQYINRPSNPRCPKFDSQNIFSSWEEILQEYSRSTHGALTLNRIERNRKEKNGGKRTAKRTRPPYSEEFLKFWSCYPRLIGKFEAYEKWCEVIKTFPPGDITTAAEEYARVVTRDKTIEKYILHPATFLNKERWKDYCLEA